MASEKIFRSAVFGGFNRSDVISYIEDLRNEISDLQRKYADKETKINELEDKVGDLTEKCASLNDLQEKYNVQCDTVEALKNENVELNNKVSELQSISDKYDESVSEFELKEQKIKTAEAQLGAAFLDARKYSDEIVSAANVKASDISAMRYPKDLIALLMNCIQASLRLPIKCPFLQMSFPREKMHLPLCRMYQLKSMMKTI